jgi:hypothetical protein
MVILLETFSKFSDMFKHLDKQLSSVLKTDVAPVIMQEMSEEIIEDTYTAYQSEADEPYVRRGLDGGLADTRNMTVEIIGDNTISITNDTGENPAYGGNPYSPIDGIIVSGRGYTWKKSEIYRLQPFPRDFYAGTIARLKKNNKHIQALKMGMRKRGFDIR